MTKKIRCVRDTLAGFRSKVKPEYAARIDNGNIEKKFVSFYIYKFSGNHTPESFLTAGEKMNIFMTVRSQLTDLGVKKYSEPWIRDIANPNKKSFWIWFVNTLEGYVRG